MSFQSTQCGRATYPRPARQRSPYLATRADLTPGPDGYVLTIEFGAPAPLGMSGDPGPGQGSSTTAAPCVPWWSRAMAAAASASE